MSPPVVIFGPGRDNNDCDQEQGHKVSLFLREPELFHILSRREKSQPAFVSPARIGWIRESELEQSPIPWLYVTTASRAISPCRTTRYEEIEVRREDARGLGAYNSLTSFFPALRFEFVCVDPQHRAS